MTHPYLIPAHFYLFIFFKCKLEFLYFSVLTRSSLFCVLNTIYYSVSQLVGQKCWVCSRALQYGQKKPHDFFFSILNKILTQTDMLYSYKCILCEFETYFQRKPIRPFPKSCNMSLEQTYGKIHI